MQETMPVPATIRQIVLIGFMGAGKSTIGPLLAQKLGWQFLDADAAIESRAGKSVAEIFAQHGESAFRALEAESIRDQAHRHNLVLALGGGALESAATRELLASLDQTCVLFLDAPLEVLVTRCLQQPGGAERPVLADRDRLLARFNARLPYYCNAHLTVTTAGLSPQAVVARIVGVLGQSCIAGVTMEGVQTQ
jgi:shikimate kinase